MDKNSATIVLILVMVVVVVGADLLFFRHQFWERLSANVGIVLIFIAVYFRFIAKL